ncbi:MAG: acylneuraminate cytidylyltransferase family protein [Pseudobutyrivibrio sp.]|nr:acylneuraminate cytidylyltransferase family protein [Pseudobutyrivibrio sp.]
MGISAVIPVREGSSRVKNKNIRSFGNSSLLEIKIDQLKRINRIDHIIVSSDSNKMLNIAKEKGVIAIERPDIYCDEKSKSFNEVVSYIAKEQVQDDIMMWTPCVCPLLSDRSLVEGIKLFENVNEKYDSIATATLIKEYIFDENGPINFSVANHVKSQDLPNWHYIVNGFFIAKREAMENWGFVYGPNPYLFEINKYEAIDIDDILDFDVAEMLYLKMKGENKGELFNS